MAGKSQSFTVPKSVYAPPVTRDPLFITVGKAATEVPPLSSGEPAQKAAAQQAELQQQQAFMDSLRRQPQQDTIQYNATRNSKMIPYGYDDEGRDTAPFAILPESGAGHTTQVLPNNPRVQSGHSTAIAPASQKSARQAVLDYLTSLQST